MLRKTNKLFVAVVMIAGFTTQLIAETPGATITTAAGGVIITPISITENSPLHFGVMAVSGTSGTCVLSTSGERSQTGGVNLSATGSAATNARYTVAGKASTTYSLTLPGSITVTKASTSTTMTIGTLVARFIGKSADAVTSTLDASGSDSFTVGGTLAIAASQPEGTYAGTFSITVAYN